VPTKGGRWRRIVGTVNYRREGQGGGFRRSVLDGGDRADRMGVGGKGIGEDSKDRGGERLGVRGDDGKR